MTADEATLPIDPGPVLDYTVDDLGEDGDCWMVRGTTDEALARRLVDVHVRAQVGAEDQAYLDTVEQLPRATTVVRSDWWYIPEAAGNYDGALLTNVEADELPVPFEGVRVTL